MTGESATDESLISGEARDWVGREWCFPGQTVTADAIRRYAAATGDPHAMYTDPDIAAEAGYPTVIAPPLMYMSLTRPIVPISELTPDGVTDDRRPPIGQGRAVAGDIAIEFVRPLVVGDRIDGVRRLASLAEKLGRSGKFVVAKWETEYTDQNGQVVVRECQSQILL